jgi:hypothetical protein
MSHFLRLYANLVTVLFLLGITGCAIVLLMTFWEDMMTIMGVEERREKREERRVDGRDSAMEGAAH